MPRWSHDDDHLPGGRVTRDLPPPAKGHGRGAWCKRWNRTAGGRWGPHLPGQPASRLHPHALVRAAFDNVGSDRHGLWVRHADTHAQSNTPAARGLTMRRSPSIGRAEARATDATRGRLARSRRSSRPLEGRIRPLERSDSTARTGRVDHSVMASRRVSRATRLHTLGRVGARAVDSLTRLDPPPLASRPQPRSTRRREWAPAEVGFDRRHYLFRRHFLCRPFLYLLISRVIEKSNTKCVFWTLHLCSAVVEDSRSKPVSNTVCPIRRSSRRSGWRSCYAPPGWDVERRETYTPSFYDDGVQRGIQPHRLSPLSPRYRLTSLRMPLV